MAKDTPRVCQRCGDFIAPENAPLPGFDLCARCFEPRAVLPEPRVLSPPVASLILGFAPPFAAALIGAFVGLLIALDADSDAAELAAIGGFLGSLLLLLSPLRGLVVAAQDRSWKRATFAALGFDPSRPQPGAFVLFAERRPRYGFLGVPEDVGLLVETDATIAILGARGARLVVAPRDVTAISVERLFLGGIWPLCVKLERASGASLWIAFKEGPTRAANRAAARALAERLKAKSAAASVSA